jgi:hypothetical protein
VVERAARLGDVLERTTELPVRPAFATVRFPYSTNMPPNPNQVDASRAFGSTLDSEGPGQCSSIRRRRSDDDEQGHSPRGN